MGINMRTTMDIDANITGMNFEKDEINEDLLLKLVTINGDGIVFKNVDEETANRVLPILLTKYQK